MHEAMRRLLSTTKRHSGFTLIELSVVLVIISLALSSLFGIANVMVERAQIRDSTDKVHLLRDRIIGYALSAPNQRLPIYATGGGTDELSALGFSTPDYWGEKLTYIYDPELVRTDIESSICSKTNTNILVRECADIACTAPTTLLNVAFVVFSRGRNGINQTGASAAPHTESAPTPSFSGPDGSATSPKTLTVFSAGLHVGMYSTPTIDIVENDDIVVVVTLEELRQRLSCQGAPLKIINTELPTGSQNAAYSSSVYASGGVPISPSTNGKYRWCAESTIPATTFDDYAIIEAVVTSTSAAVTIPLGASGSCSAAFENSASWVQGDYFRLRGTGASNELQSSTAGTSDITVFVRDDQNATASLLGTTDPRDNIISKRFVLAIHGT